MLKRIPYGPWEPDKPLTNAMRVARNALPATDGYQPMKSFGAITSALPSAFLGGAAFVGVDGNAALLAGTSDNLYKYSGLSWTAVLGQAATAWRFTQFGGLVIASTGTALYKYSLATSVASLLGGSPPAASLLATVRDFVVASGVSTALQTVYWSGFNDAEQWNGGVNQAGSQQLPDGGAIMGLVGGEYGLVFQKRAIKRMSYVGTPLVFQFDEISSNIGCMAKGSIAQVGRMVFFLSEQGFYVTDGNAPTPIGDEKFNRWFFGRFSRTDIENNLTAAVDPQRSLVMWAMPGSPGMVLVYNWLLQRATYLEVPVKALFTGFTANVSLEALDARYPGGVDSIPLSLDDAAFQGGSPVLMIVNPSSVIGTFGGPNLEAYFQTPRIELAPPRRTRLSVLRPVTDAGAAALSVDIRATDADAENTRNASVRDDAGAFPIRANGRHVSFSHTIPAGTLWTYATGMDVEFEREGSR